jgi:hypothetical protein
MTTIEDILQKQLEQIEKKFYFAVLDTHDEMVNRIFEQQKDANGGAPKPYSTEPLWISRASLEGVKDTGRKSKSGKTRYFEDGYKELKASIGRPPLELRGFLKLDFTNGIRQVGPLQFDVDVNKESLNKINGNFKTFFELSRNEKENLLKRLE